MKIIILSCLLALMTACAKPTQYHPPDQSMREHFGTIQLQTNSFNQLGPIKTPTRGTGEAAGSGAASGALGSIAAGISTCGSGEPIICVIGTSFGVLLAPVAAVVGGVVGAARAHPEEEVDQAMESFRAALNQFGHEHRLQQAFFDDAKQANVDIRIAEDDNQPEFDTRLELSFLEFKWNSIGRISPDLFLTIKLRARLVDVDQNQELYLREWAFKGSASPLYELSQNDADGLIQEMDQALATISNQMVQDLFINQSPVNDLNGLVPTNHATTTLVSAYRELEPVSFSETHESDSLNHAQTQPEKCEKPDDWSDDYETPEQKASKDRCTTSVPDSTESALSL